MPVSRAFLKPRSVDIPPQGDYEYLPIIRLVESDSAAGLEALLSTGFGVDSQSVYELYVVESVEYSTTVVKFAVGMNPGEVLYSALVWATQARRV